LFNEEFVIAGRAGNQWFARPTLSAFCKANHLVVSNSGDPKGFVDALLAERSLERRVTLTAPNFMFALALLTETDLIAAIPRRLFDLHGKRFKLEAAKPPLPLPRFALNIVTPKPAMRDAGLAWLVQTLKASVQ
jgi:DNA-binding transcriptional LysR family regulator